MNGDGAWNQREGIMSEKQTAKQKLEAIGIEQLLGRIECGESQSEIAVSLGIDVSELNRWLHSDDQRSARARAAMVESAESWLDRGMLALTNAPPDASEIARARALEQHFARRAAIRNPVYRESSKVEFAGAVTVKKQADDFSDDDLAAVIAARSKAAT